MLDLSRKLPIGVQSFEVMRNDQFIYVDKTQFIFRLVHSNRVYFLSRPRRFGKSLFLSMLKAYFLGQKELFKGLYIEKAEEERCIKTGEESWQEYPVLYFDFNTKNYIKTDSLISIINLHLDLIEETYNIKKTSGDVELRFMQIILSLHKQTGKQVVILVDEYDKPLLQTMEVNKNLNEEYRNILKAFYSAIKTCDQYIRFAFLTGVTKFSKVSIFSDLNNLKDISMLNDYAEICGITQNEMETSFKVEIEKLAKANNMNTAQTLKELKNSYDGYLFSSGGQAVYNPFSILNTFDSCEFKNYWFATGTPTFLVNYLKKTQYNIQDLDGMIELDESGLTDYRVDSASPIPILFQAGYLTIKSYNTKYKLYTLGFPNDEVRYAFLNSLLPAYSSLDSTTTAYSIKEFSKDIEEGNTESFMQRLKAIISGIPYDNLGTNLSGEKTKLREQNYQTAVYLVFKLMGQFVETEVQCSTGRADCVVTTEDNIYVFEFKLDGSGTAETALNQIKEKAYTEPYNTGNKKIIAIGVSFDQTSKTIKDWIIEKI